MPWRLAMTDEMDLMADATTAGEAEGADVVDTEAAEEEALMIGMEVVNKGSRRSHRKQPRRNRFVGSFIVFVLPVVCIDARAKTSLCEL
mmetsp:Transcript_18824/g.32642  ORF Transcript_18824/g.32642 Transcript_18824/m.32642 type:complete len:89 (+) Transcript_18824:916-1182(+)